MSATALAGQLGPQEVFFEQTYHQVAGAVEICPRSRVSILPENSR